MLDSKFKLETMSTQKWIGERLWLSPHFTRKAIAWGDIIEVTLRKSTGRVGHVGYIGKSELAWWVLGVLSEGASRDIMLDE